MKNGSKTVHGLDVYKRQAQGIKYGTPLFLGLFAFIFANGASGILRGEGDMKNQKQQMNNQL